VAGANSEISISAAVATVERLIVFSWCLVRAS
jgi:hypothetical protein